MNMHDDDAVDAMLRDTMRERAEELRASGPSEVTPLAPELVAAWRAGELSPMLTAAVDLAMRDPAQRRAHRRPARVLTMTRRRASWAGAVIAAAAAALLVFGIGRQSSDPAWVAYEVGEVRGGQRDFRAAGGEAQVLRLVGAQTIEVRLRPTESVRQAVVARAYWVRLAHTVPAGPGVTILSTAEHGLRILVDPAAEALEAGDHRMRIDLRSRTDHASAQHIDIHFHYAPREGGD